MASQQQTLGVSEPVGSVRSFCEEGRLKEALELLDGLHRQQIPAGSATYACLLQAYARRGHVDKAVKLLQRIQQDGVNIDKVTLLVIIKSCSTLKALAAGKLFHAHIVDRAIASDVVVGTALVNMYGRCGNIQDARRMFDTMGERNVVSWNVMIAIYALHGYGGEAFKLFYQMQQPETLEPDKVTFINILHACTNPEVLADGKLVHAHIVSREIESDMIVMTALVGMYIKCGNVEDARRMFDKMPERDAVSWTAMISGYAHHGCAEKALKLFHKMQQEGVTANKITYVSLLSACSCSETLALGKLVHALILRNGIELDVILENALVSMYGRCGSIEDAKRVLDKMSEPDVISWTAMIKSYTRYGLAEKAFELFQKMQLQGVKPNSITFISLLDACASPRDLAVGKLVHAQIIDSGMESDVIVGTASFNMYGRCGSIEDARRIFDKMLERDEVSWTAMITGYAQHGSFEEAFKLFQQMQHGGVSPSKITFISLLNACANPQALWLGKLVHAYIVDSEIKSDVVVGNALVSMYGECGSIADAIKTFEKMPEKDVITWNAIISVYARYGYSKQAFKLFQRMQREGCMPDKVTCLSILLTCANGGALKQGKLVHAYIIDTKIELDTSLGNALVNMYGKCGSIEDAHKIFDEMPEQDVVSWSAMVAAYAQHGCGEEAVKLFHQMQREHVIPNEITLVSVLYACSHAGLVDEGFCYFYFMSRDYGINLALEHYNCVVDLLGRAGRLDEAYDFIDNMPFQPDSVTWMTLLGSCRVHGCIDRAERAAEHALQLNPQLDSVYVSLSNTYAAAGRWDEVAKMKKVMAVCRHGCKESTRATRA